MKTTERFYTLVWTRTRHPLPAILALSVAAMLAGARSLYAIFQWGRLQPPEVVRALGFTRDKTPTVSTCSRRL